MDIMWFSALKILICVNFCVNFYVAADTLEVLKQKYANLIMECAQQYPVTPDDIEQLQRKQMSDNRNVKCLFACAYKKSEMMNDQGMLSIEGLNKLTRKYLSDDPEKLRKSEEYSRACISVNDVPVSDGVEGCDRAALIFKCSVEKAPQFDFIF